MTNEEIIENLKEAEEVTIRLAGKKFANYPDKRYNHELILTNYYLGKIRRHLQNTRKV